MLRAEGIPLPEAAERLGITTDAVRKRIQRGKLQDYYDGDKHLVVVPPDEPIVQDRVPVVPEEYRAVIAPWVAEARELRQIAADQKEQIGKLTQQVRELQRALRAMERALRVLAQSEGD